MSASSLSIGRLHSHFRSPVALDDHALHQWHDALAETDASSLVDQLVGPDEWLLIRQLDLSVSWQPDSARIEVGQRWSKALEQAIEVAVNTPGHPDVVRYASRRHGLADLLYRSALGESQRQWAWQRMGWIDRPGQHPDEVLHQGLSRLLSQPEWIWPMLHGWVGAEAHTGALTALLKAVPGSWWSLLFMRSPLAAPYAQALPFTTSMLQAEAGRGSEIGKPHTTAPGLDLDPSHLSGLAQDLWRWLRQRPALTDRHADVLAVLLAAIAWPGRGVAPSLARQRMAWSREVVRQATLLRQSLRREAIPGLHEAVDASAAHAPDEPRPLDADATPTQLEKVGQAPDTDSTPSRDLPAAPDLPDTATWLKTNWAGALFWLRLAVQPDVLNQAPNLVLPSLADALTDPMGHALLAIAGALGVPDGDPAQLAMVGGQWPEGQLMPRMDQALNTWAAQQVQRWSDWLADQAPDLPEPRVRAICQRPGRLRMEPGWIELHLPLDQVDTRIRRLGLDIDPGHLTPLGCVLRICYD